MQVTAINNQNNNRQNFGYYEKPSKCAAKCINKLLSNVKDVAKRDEYIQEMKTLVEEVKDNPIKISQYIEEVSGFFSPTRSYCIEIDKVGVYKKEYGVNLDWIIKAMRKANNKTQEIVESQKTSDIIENIFS